MTTKMDVRNLIDISKDEYSKSKDKTKLLEVAILKGVYLALGGEKAIPVPNKLNNIVISVCTVIKYKIKLGSVKNVDRAYGYLYSELLKQGKQPDYFIGDKVPMTNTDLAKLIALMVSCDYTEDLIINSQNVYNISFDILNILDER